MAKMSASQHTVNHWITASLWCIGLEIPRLSCLQSHNAQPNKDLKTYSQDSKCNNGQGYWNTTNTSASSSALSILRKLGVLCTTACKWTSLSYSGR
ncbi:hypothetical protein GCK32_010496 [Trichostrongylus colubriformis]|uniref:Uncharacterized protein n=1 Tax=Trichostrongylus colubriformis TaxID=6319 RepID=A0AAN8G752_TRICO